MRTNNSSTFLLAGVAAFGLACGSSGTDDDPNLQQKPWNPSPETTTICKLTDSLPGTDCHGDNLGDAKGPIDNSHLADWWQDSGPWRDFAKDPYGSSKDWLKDKGKEILKDWFGIGDPHMVGLAKQSFDLLARGDFLYTKTGTAADYFEVQVRHRGAAGAAIIGAMAFKFGDGAGSHRVEIHSDPARQVVDGKTVNMGNNEILFLFDANAKEIGSVLKSGSLYIVMNKTNNVIYVWAYPDGFSVEGYMMVGVDAVPRGALGNLRGLAYADGLLVKSPITTAEWTRFLRDWSVSGANSLFTMPGDAFSVPDGKFPSAADLTQQQKTQFTSQAQQLVGTASEWTLNSCLYDLAIIGPTDFAKKSCQLLPKQPASNILIQD